EPPTLALPATELPATELPSTELLSTEPPTLALPATELLSEGLVCPGSTGTIRCRVGGARPSR
ncbi:MAG: hypothetical protein JJU45_20230, partial [Acidimicrobiia bacterium]|nr:hypothetical protein [Acidimicrobiia bacterium]